MTKNQIDEIDNISVSMEDNLGSLWYEARKYGRVNIFTNRDNIKHSASLDITHGDVEIKITSEYGITSVEQALKDIINKASKLGLKL